MRGTHGHLTIPEDRTVVRRLCLQFQLRRTLKCCYAILCIKRRNILQHRINPPKTKFGDGLVFAMLHPYSFGSGDNAKIPAVVQATAGIENPFDQASIYTSTVAAGAGHSQSVAACCREKYHETHRPHWCRLYDRRMRKHDSQRRAIAAYLRTRRESGRGHCRQRHEQRGAHPAGCWNALLPKLHSPSLGDDRDFGSCRCPFSAHVTLSHHRAIFNPTLKKTRTNGTQNDTYLQPAA